MGGYKYGGTGKSMSEQEVAERLAATRATAAARINGASAPGVAPPSAQPVITPGRPERFGPEPTLKGAVKVAAFPTPSPYPFAEIAADGGIWKLDPAAFTWRGKPVRNVSIRSAASKYATEHGLRAKTVINGGFLYVQFTRDGPR